MDVTVLFPASGIYALAKDNLAPQLAAAISHDYHDWLAEFCSENSQHLLSSAMILLHNIIAAVAEARQTVQDHILNRSLCIPHPIGETTGSIRITIRCGLKTKK